MLDREKGTNEGTENRWQYHETYEGNQVNRQEDLAPTVGNDLKHYPTRKIKKDQEKIKKNEKHEARIH